MALCHTDVLSYIENADDVAINEIMAAVNRRFRSKFPDWEVLYISCPKFDQEAREQTLAYIQKYFHLETE